jgi:NADH-quinone oxidoreductase subunit L
MLATAALCTAFYMWRLYFLVFTGEFRGTAEQAHHLHESPSEMTFPLIVLAIGSALVGFIGVPAVMSHGFPESAEQLLSAFPSWLHKAGLLSGDEPHSHAVEWGLMLLALAISGAGIALAARLYRGGISTAAENLAKRLGWLYRLLWNKYYIDEIYDLIIVRPLKVLARVLWRFADATVVDGGLTKLGPAIVSGFGILTRRLQNGDVQRYVVAVVVGAAAILFTATYWLPLRGAQSAVSIEKHRVTLMLGGGKVPPGRLVYRIDWGGDSKSVETSRFTSLHHEYGSPGDYTIRIEAQDPQWGVSEHSTQHVKIE